LSAPLRESYAGQAPLRQSGVDGGLRGIRTTHSRPAAIRAAGILFQTELLASEIVAMITPETCRRCLACVTLCPFEAVALSDGKPQVRLEVCRGCGWNHLECSYVLGVEPVPGQQPRRGRRRTATDQRP